MPAGNRMMGRQNPTTPGSIKPGVARTWTFGGRTTYGMSTAALTRTARRMRHHIRDRSTTIAANPHAHSTRMARPTQPAEPGVDSAVATPDDPPSRNGWLTCAIVDETAGTTAVVVAVDGSGSLLPSVTSTENGMKNLTELLNQSQ